MRVYIHWYNVTHNINAQFKVVFKIHNDSIIINIYIHTNSCARIRRSTCNETVTVVAQARIQNEGSVICIQNTPWYSVANKSKKHSVLAARRWNSRNHCCLSRQFFPVGTKHKFK
jgi:hypothetical protein